eukprot:285914_1
MATLIRLNRVVSSSIRMTCHTHVVAIQRRFGWDFGRHQDDDSFSASLGYKYDMYKCEDLEVGVQAGVEGGQRKDDVWGGGYGGTYQDSWFSSSEQGVQAGYSTKDGFYAETYQETTIFGIFSSGNKR